MLAKYIKEKWAIEEITLRLGKAWELLEECKKIAEEGGSVTFISPWVGVGFDEIEEKK